MELISANIVIEVPAEELQETIKRLSNKDEALSVLQSLARGSVARHWPEGTTDENRQQVRIEFTR